MTIQNAIVTLSLSKCQHHKNLSNQKQDYYVILNVGSISSKSISAFSADDFFISKRNPK